jgi:RNA polymerase sigma-70 factor (ECF subfamily)
LPAANPGELEMLRKPHQNVRVSQAPDAPTTSAETRSRAVELEQLDMTRLLDLCLESQCDESLWTEFVRRSRPSIVASVIKSIRRWTNPTNALVEDLVQDTYLKLCYGNFKALRRLRCENQESLHGFLKVVASNVVCDHFRGAYSQKRGRGRKALNLDEAPVVHAGTNRPQDMEQRILLAQIDRCLQYCSASRTLTRDRAIFWLHYKVGLTAKSISRVPSLGLTTKGVESTLGRLTRLVRSQADRQLMQGPTDNDRTRGSLPKPELSEDLTFEHRL